MAAVRKAPRFPRPARRPGPRKLPVAAPPPSARELVLAGHMRNVRCAGVGGPQEAWERTTFDALLDDGLSPMEARARIMALRQGRPWERAASPEGDGGG